MRFQINLIVVDASNFLYRLVLIIFSPIIKSYTITGFAILNVQMFDT